MSDDQSVPLGAYSVTEGSALLKVNTHRYTFISCEPRSATRETGFSDGEQQVPQVGLRGLRCVPLGVRADGICKNRA